eukprot:864452_1
MSSSTQSEDLSIQKCTDNMNTSTIPWQITLMSVRLIAALFSSLRQTCYKIQAEEQNVLKDMDSYSKDMTNLRSSLDFYESIVDSEEQADKFSTEKK